MLSGIKTKVRWRAHKGKAIAAALLVVIGVMIFSGFATDIGLALFYRLPSGGLGAAPHYGGPVSLEERVLESEVIARIKLRSMSPGVEAFHSAGYDENGEWIEDTAYANALEFRFEVLEYLKGGGGDEIVGIVEGTEGFHTRIAAQMMSKDLTETHDTTWDDNEAIVFLRKNPIFLSTQNSGRYWLGGYYGSIRDEGYTVNSHYRKAWLPAADGVEYIDKIASTNGNDGEKRFLTGADRAEGESYSELIDYRVANNAYNTALGAGGDSSTITLSELKGIIAELEDEVAAGDGSEEYSQCVLEKYRWNREVEYHHAVSEYGYRTESPEHELSSGLPANTVFALGSMPFQPPDNYDPADIYVNDIEIETWLEGEDAHLFHAVDDNSLVGNVRPLPRGKYRFYFNSIDPRYIPCNAYPDRLRTWEELVVHVHAPHGTLHEAFFDPADIDDAVGSDGYDGLLQSEWFKTDDGEVLIERIEWQDGQVEMELSPAADLFGRRMDFITLDGSVALRLDFDEDIGFEDEDDTSTFTWGVCEQPWQDGDLLMLRIASRNSTDGIQATNDLECLNATSEPEPTPTPSP